MKVIKDTHHGLLLNRFGIKDKYYLVVTILIFFDLDRPDSSLNEQEMWRFFQAQAGGGAILDTGMPKMNGEVIIYGSCFPAQGSARASMVAFGMEGIRKKLSVFGDRIWIRKGGISVISEPEPFREMPIRWENAFGGRHYKMNPLGKGIDPVILPDGREVIPLPNIEDPDHLIGSPSDRPEPVCFMPIDMMWPQRFKKHGTYDERWLRDRWPFYPEDMDWSFFNCASEDQQRSSFFRGGEEFFIENMHPERSRIFSTIPALRQRCFINRLMDIEKPEGETLFQEVETRIDTLILFPHALRGIALWRGTAEIYDDEALDVLHLFIVTESLKDKPKDLDYYHEAFKRRVEGDITDIPELQEAESMMKEAEAEIARAEKQLKELPRRINDSILMGIGEAPRRPLTPEEIIRSSIKTIEENEEILGDMGSGLQDLKEEFGHILKIDSMDMSSMRKDMARIKDEFKDLEKRVSAINKDVEASKQEIKSRLESEFKRVSEIPEIKDRDISIKEFISFLEPKKENLWTDSGMKFLEECRAQLLNDKRSMEILGEMGLSEYTIEWAWLGLNREEKRYKGSLWELEQDEISIPQGLVIPYFEKDNLKRIIIRPDITPDSSKDVVISGSKDINYRLSTSLVDGTVVVVRDELEALLLHQDIWDISSVVAIKDPHGKMDKKTESMIKNASCILVPEYSEDYISAWKEMFPESVPVSMPEGARDMFSIRASGISLRKWFLNVLRPDVKKKLIELAVSEDIDLEEEYLFNVDLVSTKVRDAIYKSVNMENIESLKDQATEIIANIKERLKKVGIPDSVLDHITMEPEETGKEPEEFIHSSRERLSRVINDARAKLKATGLFTNEAKMTLDEVEKTHTDALKEAEERLKDAKAKIQGLKDLSTKGGLMPDWARELASEADKGGDELAKRYEKLTREEVIEFYDQGKSLSEKDLSGVDLSGLNLKGADLKSSLLEGTIFRRASLDNADLSEVIASSADFSDASLKGANLTKGLFDSAKFKHAHLNGACLKDVLAEGADFQGADLSGAELQGIIFNGAKLKGIICEGANARDGVFIEVDATDGVFRGAELGKALFSKSTLREANFSEAKVQSTIFMGTNAKGAKFVEADLYDNRIVEKSDFSGVEFANVRADRSCWIGSDLSGSDFQGSSLDQALVQDCDLSGSALKGVSARKARFERADLSEADMRNVNLFKGSLRKARLNRTDLKGANLYGVEFYRTKVRDTNLNGANLKRTKLEGREKLIQ